MNSRAKGKRGELEWAQYLRDAGFTARRGQQFSGGAESPDVISSIVGVHWEVKLVQALNIGNAMEQAEADAPKTATPVVAHRRNNKPWLVTMRGIDFLRIVRALGGTVPSETQP